MNRFTDAQIQPASIDLRLGAVAIRVRASFLPGKNATVEDKLAQVFMHEIDLSQGAVLEAGCVYIVKLLERAEFSARIAGAANPKSSTGRIDVFTRLITDRAKPLTGWMPVIAARFMPRSARRLFPSWCARVRASTNCASAMARRNSATRNCAACMPRRRWWMASRTSITGWAFRLT